MQISIIIVNYNTCSLLRNCLKSLFEQTKYISFEVIVSDNGSTDGSIEMLKSEFPQVILIENNANLGFGAANNRALDIAKGKYIFYLNSDTILLNNAPKLFYDYFETHKDEKIGALGSILLDDENHKIHSYAEFPTFKVVSKQLLKMFFTNIILTLISIFHIPVNKSNLKKDDPSSLLSYDKLKNVDYITGADLFLLNNHYARFNEDFFLYYEDTILNYELYKNGYIRRIIEGPKIIHLCGGSVQEKLSIQRKASFSRIQFEISRYKWIKYLYPNNKLIQFIISLQISLLWLNPFLISKTYKYFKFIWR